VDGSSFFAYVASMSVLAWLVGIFSGEFSIVFGPLDTSVKFNNGHRALGFSLLE